MQEGEYYEVSIDVFSFKAPSQPLVAAFETDAYAGSGNVVDCFTDDSKADKSDGVFWHININTNSWD